MGVRSRAGVSLAIGLFVLMIGAGLWCAADPHDMGSAGLEHASMTSLCVFAGATAALAPPPTVAAERASAPLDPSPAPARASRPIVALFHPPEATA